MLRIPRLKFFLEVIILLSLIAPYSFGAKVYKWVDKDGVIHVTDKPKEIPEEHVGSIEEIHVKKNEFKSLIRSTLELIKSNLHLLALGIVGIFFFLMIMKLIRKIKLKNLDINKKRRLKAFDKSGIDKIDEAALKKSIKTLLENNGYTVSEVTFEHYNPGIDFIAERKGDRYYVELAANYDLVPGITVSDAEREKHRYGCNKVMLITKNFSDEEAIELSKSTGSILIDRLILAQWMLDSNKNIK